MSHTASMPCNVGMRIHNIPMCEILTKPGMPYDKRVCRKRQQLEHQGCTHFLHDKLTMSKTTGNVDPHVDVEET